MTLPTVAQQLLTIGNGGRHGISRVENKTCLVGEHFVPKMLKPVIGLKLPIIDYSSI